MVNYKDVLLAKRNYLKLKIKWLSNSDAIDTIGTKVGVDSLLSKTRSELMLLNLKI